MPDPITLTADEMAEPVSEQIVIYLTRLLEQLTLDNGYSMDCRVERFDEDGNAKGAPNGQGMIIIEEQTPQPTWDGVPCTLDGYQMTITAICVVKNKKAVTDEASGRVINRIVNDVIRIVRLDETLGGYCLPCDVGSTKPANALGKLPAAIVPIDLIFWTKRKDPYTSFKDIT